MKNISNKRTLVIIICACLLIGFICGYFGGKVIDFWFTDFSIVPHR